jgi:2-oxoglutarate ferredoxin oxidoreductase subunit beta
VNIVGLAKTDYREIPAHYARVWHNSISPDYLPVTNWMLFRISSSSVGLVVRVKAQPIFLTVIRFNGLHGRMPSGNRALFGDHSAWPRSEWGWRYGQHWNGQFKHVLRRNLRLVYIVENNGVYGLTKGQFSATADIGLNLKGHGTNPYMPIDIAWEALVGNASFVARSFAGDPKQVKELIKAALSHNGIAVLDIISLVSPS